MIPPLDPPSVTLGIFFGGLFAMIGRFVALMLAGEL